MDSSRLKKLILYRFCKISQAEGFEKRKIRTFCEIIMIIWYYYVKGPESADPAA